MESLSPSTINVRLSAMRKMVGEARRAGMIGLEEAASLTDLPNIRQKGTRLGNWLTREQAKELLAVPDRSTLKGKRDYVILALLVGCALRRKELAELDIETIQHREGGGSWPTSKARAGASAPSPSRSGLSRHQRLDNCGRNRRWSTTTVSFEEWEGQSRHAKRLGDLVGS
jgi:integrase